MLPNLYASPPILAGAIDSFGSFGTQNCWLRTVQPHAKDLRVPNPPNFLKILLVYVTPSGMFSMQRNISSQIAPPTHCAVEN